MAATFQSVASTTPANGTSVVITKPTGLSVGDVMIAHIGNTASISTLSGWASLLNGNNGSVRFSVQYKIADAGDVAATNFTFSGSSGYIGGAIYRISGGSIITSPLTTWTGTSANLNIGVTPSANDLLLILVQSESGASSSVISNHAIATSNPSWTEDYDVDSNINNIRINGAHATRPETTPTGNITFSSGTSVTNGMACIIVVSNTLDIASIASSALDPVVTGGTTFTLDTAIAAMSAPEVNAGQAKWSNQSKNTTSWTNQSKN